MRRVCVFCGASPGRDPAFVAVARAMGDELARRGIGLVYGGGGIGLMGAVADAALAAGGEVIGVIPRALATRELAHAGLSDLRVVASMHERKATMADLADGFVALPGGLGTLEEIAEVITWTQLGFHDKPCALLDAAGYWRPLLAWLDHAVDRGFVGDDARALVLAGDDPAALLDAMAAWRAPTRPPALDPALR